MIKIKLFEPDGLYTIRSMSSANSMFFSSKKDKKVAFDLMNKFLAPMMDIVAYSFTQKGWALVFKARSREEIEKAYDIQYNKSTKAKPGNRKEDARYMISEHFRFFNCGLVKSINGMNKRSGSMVKKRIEKFIFESLEDFELGIKIVESGQVMEKQKLEKFDPDPKEYNDQGMKGGDNEWKNSRRCNSMSYSRRVFAKKLLRSFIFVMNKLDVVRQWIKTTFNQYFPQNPQTQHPKLE